MLLLKQKLRKALENYGRVAVLGVGSELRGDDAAGLLALSYLQKKKYPAPQSRTRFVKRAGGAARPARKGPVLKLFNGGTAPENLTGEIRRFRPDCLIIIDAADLGKRAGAVALVELEKIADASFSTHKLPLKLMLDYLAAETKLAFVFLGIQPKSLEFGAPVSEPVRRAARDLAGFLAAVLW
ncbi:MAG: hydrogenase 3 maturation endopeptidase HyCI [Kiritimatiellae bacterium]|jgi:hydrogenase 3 maturation protease|nr:hydrogenase 3 maturation endopeptidase HyCI [Kiritimatiellia bacterium]